MSVDRMTPSDDVHDMRDEHARARYVVCPSIEAVLLTDGRLLLVPTRDRPQLQVDAPWGRLIHEVVVQGHPVDRCVPVEDRDVVHATIRHLAASDILIPASRVAAADVERFDRQVRWFAQEGMDGPHAQRRLAAATVLVLGVGGFGASMAELLARAGVGRLVLVDSDRVEDVNLARQMLYDERDVGSRKSFAAAAHLERIAVDIEAEPIDLELSCTADVARLVRRYRPDLVVCAADRPPMQIKHWVDDGAFAAGVPVLHGGSRPPFAFAGPLLVPGQTPCFECFYNSRIAPGGEELEREVGERRDLFPPSLPAAGWCDVSAASLSAAQVIAQLTGVHEPALLGREWEVDLRTFTSAWIDPGTEQGDVSCGRCEVRKAA